MLENVQHINWQAIGFHVYDEPETIPAALHSLLSSNPNIRESAREFLLGSGQDYGNIYDTTPYIIPFILEILGSDTTQDKADLLDHLAAVAEHIYLYEHPTVEVMRRYLHTYDALKAGLPVVEQLLHHQDPATRIASSGVLQYMTDDATELIPRLVDRFGEEHDEQVQVALLRGMKPLLRSLILRFYRAGTEHAPFLRAVLETHPSRRVRVAAASMSVELMPPYEHKPEVVSPYVPELLTQEFLEQTQALDNVFWLFKNVEEAIRDLVRLPPEIGISVLQRPDLTPQQAHLLARALLQREFLSNDLTRRHQDKMRFNGYAPGVIYVQHFPALTYMRHRKNHILEGIINAEMVWHIPTNIFSFWFGLPDSREELRALLNEVQNEALRPRQIDQAQNDLPDF